MTAGRLTSRNQPAALPRSETAAEDAWSKRLQYAENSQALFWLFLCYVLFFYLQGGFRYEVFGRIRFEMIVGSILVVASALSISAPRRGARKQEKSGVVGWVVATFAVAALMSAMSYAPEISWDVLVDRVLKLAMMALFISAMITSPKRLRWFLVTYLFAFLKMAQEGVLGFFTGSLVWENQGTPRLHGSTPNYAHPNSFSGTQLGTLPFLRYLYPLVSKWIKWIILGQALAAIMIVVTTGSRTGYVATGVWILFLLLQSKQKFKAIAIAIISLGIAWPLIPEDYHKRLDTIFTQKDQEGASIDMRKQIYSDAWEIFKSHPFGVGVGAFSTVRYNTFKRDQATHELYLEVACDLGIQGFIIFMGLVLSMLRASRRVVKRVEDQLAQLPVDPTGTVWNAAERERLNGHRADLDLIRATAQAVFSFLIIRLGLGLFGHDFYEIYWWFSAGILIALFRILSTAEERTQHFVTVSKQPA